MRISDWSSDVCSSDLPSPPEMLAVWDELRIELNVGQYLDLLGTARADTDHEAARLISRYKSGKYTIERPLHIGPALARRPHELQAPLPASRDPLGQAFPLRDDPLRPLSVQSLTRTPQGAAPPPGTPPPPHPPPP